ncbi:cation-independent mannose-6-phosphate receptor-like [Babylonia areolata]|uniref:cation-independent mannose-6-phosphate receptor-like n=1 Tax=Babylonia areolata TaxID=304850 RepID=UPI003FD5E695
MAADKERLTIQDRMSLSFVCYTLILINSAFVTEATDCSIGGFDLTRLQSFNPWRTGHKKTDIVFDISICDASKGCSNGISVVGRNETSGVGLSYGSCAIRHNSTEADDSELLVLVQGAECPLMPNETLTAAIYFRCGKKLGQPVYLGDFGCSVYFEWESFEFCTDLEHPANEIPCYVYNNSQIIDLSPLTKLKGGYLVDQENGREFHINVCRDITPDAGTGTGACPKGSSSCRIIDGVGANFGQPNSKLAVVGQEIRMTYNSTGTPAGCVDHPQTVVSFRCPERGGSKEPMLLSDFACNVQIEWWTEYACPQQTLTSQTCQLTMESHNVDIDLSPLTKPAGSPYHLTAKSSSGDSYDYFINVCGPLGIACGKDHDEDKPVCQVKTGTTDEGKILGDEHHKLLRYSDGQLSLVYKNGDQCHTKFRRTTIINFQCDLNATDGGVGIPEFREEGDCTYIFDWKTRYACIDHPEGSGCHVVHDGKLFDLSSLTLEQGSNWLALSDEGGDAGYEYYVNVCHDVLHEGDASGCPAGASICRKGSSKSVSLGSYTEGLKYDPVTQKIYINYTMAQSSDHECSGTINSIITFICKPGDLESGPALVHKSGDMCVYQFEWYTAAACPLSHQHGQDCHVVDTQAGFSFDLSGLMKKSGDGYKVSAGDYDYYINVCGKIGGDHCKDKNAAICQVKKDGSAEIKTGEPSQALEYFNGVLNLTYTDGDAYHDDAQTPRKTEIAFVCDMEAGAGHPEFLVEEHQTYSFKWLTAYACPAQPIECVAQDENGKQYDLSSLSKSAAGENWVVLDDSDTSNRRKFYINVCRPLSPIHGLTSSSACDLNAAVCMTTLSGEEETVKVANLGQAKTGPKMKVARNHYLSLEYTDGAPCPDGGEGARYNTTIHFICSQGQQSHGPSPPRKVGPCSYEVIWDTGAACALEETDSGDSDSGIDDGTMPSCTVTDHGYTYNLASLKKSGDDFYTAHTGSKTFRLNICGSVPSSECDAVDGKPASVCEVLPQHNTGLTLASTMDLKVTEENNIRVTYTGQRDSSGQMTEVQIELACNREANESTPITFVSQRGHTYQFRLETPVSCPLHPIDCIVQDRKGNQYDLTPLAKVTGNYDVADSRPSHRDLHYLINVCRPINEVAGTSCPGGPIGGCQTGGREPYSLGYLESKPHVAEDGTISLRYIGGSVCHRGTPQEARRSMRISLFCSHVEGTPQFLGESDNCEYTFSWSTPSACPLQRSQGDACKVSDPLYNFQFDLTPLRKSGLDYAVPGGDYTFKLNVCGPLQSPPDECKGMGACQTGSSLPAPVAAGKPSSKLIYDTGELSLVYDDGKPNCHGKYTRKSIITFLCDHSKKGANSEPQYLQELEDCTYTFVWPTALACPPHGVVDCTYTDPKTGNHYDLSGLSLTGANYVKPYGDISYIINVCRSLVHRKGETCPFNSAACMINSTETDLKKKYQSLGQVSTNPVGMEEGQLVIRYNNGAACSKGGNMSTLIILSCPTTPSTVEAGPSSHFVRDYCQNGFVWTTSAACPVESGSSEGGAIVQGSCKATNPVSHYEFDLSPLRKTSGAYKMNDRQGHYFYINVCGAVDNATCSDSGSAGSCQVEINGEERSFNAGNMNANLRYLRNGVLMLNYSGGDVCHHNNVPRTSIINFICHQGAGNGVPTYVDNSDGCVYYFDWHTELVCEEQVLCEVNTGTETFDLTPLIKESGHHLAVPDMPGSDKDRLEARGTFYINVCRPLNPIFSTLCPAGAAACREIVGQPPQSLGQARSRPEYNTTRKQVTLTYDHGEPCAKNSNVNASTLIIFICKKGFSEGVPRLVEVSEACVYVFEWETNVVCSDTAVEKETTNCTYYDQRTDYLFDLSALKDMQQIDSPQGGKISIQACGSLPTNLSASCQGAAVCLVGSRGSGSASLQDGSFGSATTGQFQMDGEQLKLSFSSGQKCQHDPSRTASTNIFFECDHSAGNGQPEPMPHFSCELNFKWRTSLVCPPLIQDCVVSSGDATFDLTILSQTRESWEFIHEDGSRYWINLCQVVHGEARKEKCPPNSAVCRHTKDGQVDMLGDLRSQKISVEEDGTVVIEYSQGTSACSSGRRRSNNPLARSVIRLQCGTTVGSPVLQSSTEDMENCLFQFTWKTRAVCKKDSLPQVLTDVNQVIQDPRSGGSIDLRPLLRGGNHQAFDGKYKYIVNLEGHLALDHNNAATSACSTAAVCQQLSDDASYHHNLGTFASHQYYLNEDQLEVMYTSTEKCFGKYSDKYITSIITFSCSSSDRRTDPVFRYRTLDCTYLFTWETPAACMQAKIEVATGGSVDDSQISASGKSDTGGINKTTLITVVSIFSGVLIICLLAVVFHKPERRAAAAARLKRIVLCQRSTENQIRYSVLAQMEEDPEADGLGTNPFEEDMENELQNGDTMGVGVGVGVRGYHDDSDDDMLL